MAQDKKKIRVVVIDHDPEARHIIREAADHVNGVDVIADTDSFIYGYELIRQNRPELVFVDIREDPHRSLELIQRIATYFRETVIYVSGHELSLEYILACMQAGAREYLTRPLTTQGIVQVIERHYYELTVDPTEGDTTGRIVTVFSNKGGLGKSTVAVNLALALSETIDKPVALVDLNLQLGDITTFLDITPKQSIVDIAKNIGRVDEAYLESSLAQYRRGNSHVYVIADPVFVEDAEEVSAEQINTILTVLRSIFEYVIIDTTTSFDSKTLTALDLADQIMLVSMVNLPCIRSSQRVLTLFERLGYDEDKIKIVLNRYIPGDDITVEDVEATLEYPVYWKIPNNYQVVMSAINRGMPVFEIENSEKLWNNFMSLACQVSGVVPKRLRAPAGQNSAEKKQRKSLLSGLFGK